MFDDTITLSDLETWDSEAAALDDSIRSLVAISTLASANRPSAIAQIAQRRLDQLGHLSDKVHYVQQTRESILKMTSIMGTPKGINALSSLMSQINKDTEITGALSELPPLRSRDSFDYDQIRARGEQLFRDIYDRHAPRVVGSLSAMYPDLAEVILVDSYGHLLAETRYLSGMETELCAIGSLIPQDVPSQLKSHCIGAGRLGASEEMVQAALRLAKLVCLKRL
ncbi:hypothetical protein FBU59_003496 [Linderina macrospora]|uniref:Uncharacterized protein n=1 Tax=Linderina macrospora TaxID=4868 RepID=A0ACC1J828_9FUNG|nr:hypothetical protein FBU59_003496 [Linderina macrospora]